MPIPRESLRLTVSPSFIALAALMTSFATVADSQTIVYQYDFYEPGTTTVAASFQFIGFVRDVSPASTPLPGFTGFIPPSALSLVPCDLTSNSSAELDCRAPTLSSGIFFFQFDFGAFPSKLGPFTGSGFLAPDGANPSIRTVALLNGQITAVGPPEAQVQLVLGEVTRSNWDTDSTTIGASVRISNVGAAVAGDVTINSLAIEGGLVTASEPLPLRLGGIAPGTDSVLDLVAQVTGTSHLLTIGGSYVYLGKSFSFSITADISPPVDPLPVIGLTVVSPQDPALASYPPAPPDSPFEPNEGSEPPVIPTGPPRQIFTPTQTEADVSPANAAVVVTNTTFANAGRPPDPNAASSGDVVLATYNTGISWSRDGGQNFTNVNLFQAVPGNPARTSFFPQDDGGLCCDQIVVYLPKQDLFVWLLQYNTKTTIQKNQIVVTQPNRLRIAWATPAAIVSDFSNAWRFFDLTATHDALGLSGNDWLDFPDLAYSDTYLYIGVNRGFGSGDKNAGLKVYSDRRIVARVLISDMTSGNSFVYGHTELTGTGLASSHFAQGSPERQVLAALKDSSTLRVFSLRDDQNTWSRTDVAITSIKKAEGDYSCKSPPKGGLDCTAPDGVDWYVETLPGKITGAAGQKGVAFSCPPFCPAIPRSDIYTFAFAAGRNINDGRPAPYVRIETLQLDNPGSGEAFRAKPISEDDIFRTDRAFGLATMAARNVIGVAGGGGSGGYPQFYFRAGGSSLSILTSSNATQFNTQPNRPTRFGDYFSVRPVGANNDWAVAAYDVLQNQPGVSCAIRGCTAIMRYVRIGPSFIP